MPVRRSEPAAASGPARFLSLFRRMRADADPVQLVHTAGDDPPSPDALTPNEAIDQPEADDPDLHRLRTSREDNPFLRRLSGGRPEASSAEHAAQRRTSSAGPGDQLAAAEVHSRLVRSPPPSRARRRSPTFFQIHEKAKIVVIPTSQLRPIKTRQREEVMDRSLQYILQTQQALPVKRDLSAERSLSRRLSGPTAPPLAPRAISAISTSSGRLASDRAFDQLPAALFSASFESKDALRKANARVRSRHSLSRGPQEGDTRLDP